MLDAGDLSLPTSRGSSVNLPCWIHCLRWTQYWKKQTCVKLFCKIKYMFVLWLAFSHFQRPYHRSVQPRKGVRVPFFQGCSLSRKLLCSCTHLNVTCHVKMHKLAQGLVALRYEFWSYISSVEDFKCSLTVWEYGVLILPKTLAMSMHAH